MCIYTNALKDKFGPVSSLVAQMIKNLPAMWETWVQSLGWEDTLEESKQVLKQLLHRMLRETTSLKSKQHISKVLPRW